MTIPEGWTEHCYYTKIVGDLVFSVEFSAEDGRWIVKRGRRVLPGLYYNAAEAMAAVDAMIEKLSG